MADEKMQAIIAAVQSQGVPDRDIQTAQLNLFSDPQANIYQANNQATVRTEDVGKAGEILDAALEAGANASGGIHFSFADQSELEDRALEQAVADARHKAELLATTLGVVLDGVDQLIVAGPMMTHDASLPRGIRAPSHVQAAPIEVGQLRVSADVQVRYTFH